MLTLNKMDLLTSIGFGILFGLIIFFILKTITLKLERKKFEKEAKGILKRQEQEGYKFFDHNYKEISLRNILPEGYLDDNEVKQSKKWNLPSLIKKK